jgi:di/tricarboxylate transporter
VTFEIALLLALIVAALVLFSTDWLPSDVVALGLLLMLILTGILAPRDAFAGFGSDTVIMILGLLILTAALIKTGVVEIVGRAILRHAGTNPTALLALVMMACALLSAFISNTAAAAFFLPIALGIAAKAKVSPSRLLLPIAFASILTSSVTLISTSTNVVISGLMTNAGLAPMGMFELTPVGLPLAVVGLLYVFFIGRHLIRERAPAPGLLEEFGLRSYISEVVILPESPLVGKSIRESGFGRDLELQLLRVVRKPDRYLLPRQEMVLEANDVLLVEGAQAEILKVKDKTGIEIRADLELSDPDLRSEDASLVEALVVPGSRLVGRTLRDMQVRRDYGVQVLALNRHGRNLISKLSKVNLRVGDVLLVQGRTTSLQRFATEGYVSVLRAVQEETGKRPKAWWAMGIFVAALVLATTNLVPLPVAVLLGAFGVLAVGCVAPADAYREIDWRVLILIGSMLALGQAMTQTGAADYLAQLVVSLTSGFSPMWVVAGFFIFTVLLTQPMSNQAAAAVIVPIAVQAAGQLELNPRTFVMAIAVAASCSYLTPLEPACLMVYGPGRYRFTDFLRVGGPLVLILFAIAMWLVPKVWPL